MEKMTQIFYDKNADVLYLSIGDPRPAISEELGDDVLLRHDIETGKVVGLTIFNFASRFGESENAQTLPFELEVHTL
jgi:uncharacterized protein YuzE